jgi:hypothetical protein
VHESWQEIGRRDLQNRWGKPPEENEVAQWVDAMKELLARIEPGKEYVCIDGHIIATDAPSICFIGWHARHDLNFVPQVEALSDPDVLKSLLANREYWTANAVREHE